MSDQSDVRKSMSGCVNAGACSGSNWCLTLCYGFRVERHVSWKRCAAGFEIRFSCLVGVSKMSAPSAATCI